MTFETWALFALAITVASISPGPNVLIVMVNAAKHGIRGAAITIFGNLCTLFCVALLAAIGVGALLKTMPVAFTTMKVAGGLYLIWMGCKIIRNSFANMSDIDVNGRLEVAHASFADLFLQAVLVSASNPKSIIFLSAIFPQFL